MVIKLATLPPNIQKRVAVLTDGSAATLEEAISQWATTDELSKDFQTQITTLQTTNSKLRLLAYKAKIAMASVAGNSLFLSQDARNQIDEFQNYYKSLQSELEPPF